MLGGCDDVADCDEVARVMGVQVVGTSETPWGAAVLDKSFDGRSDSNVIVELPELSSSLFDCEETIPLREGSRLVMSSTCAQSREGWSGLAEDDDSSHESTSTSSCPGVNICIFA